MAFFIDVSGLMLFESLRRSFAGHTDIETFQHPVKLRIGCPEPCIFGKYPFGEFNDVNLIFQSGANFGFVF